MPSTAIATLGYDEAKRELYVTFTSGRHYIYFDVPRGRYIAFTRASSKGRFFNYYIRDHFDFKEVQTKAA
jgi:hypothetical protein